jgi:hypothetical protein
MASHALNHEVQTQRTEIQSLKSENHSLTVNDASLRVTNSNEHKEIQAGLKKMEPKSGLPHEFKGSGDFKIVDGHKEIARDKSPDYEAKAGHTKVPNDRAGEDSTADKPKCDANDKDAKPTPNAEGFNRVTHCGPDGKPADRTVFDLNGKTKMGEITYGDDGGKKMISFAPDGSTASNVQVDHPNRDTELTTLGPKGNMPSKYSRFNSDGSQVDIVCDGKGNAASSKMTDLHLATIQPKSADDKQKLETMKSSVCKPVDLGPYKPAQ